MILRFNTSPEVASILDTDDAIYHFTKKSTALEFILNNKKLRLSPLSNTNDPREYKRKMILVLGVDWEDEESERLGNFRKSVYNTIKSAGFISFCQNRYENSKLEQHGCLKSRMWSQYGDNHSGVCFVFSKKTLVEQIKKQFERTHSIFYQSVMYNNLYETESKSTLSVKKEQLMTNAVNDIAYDYVIKDHERIFFHKQPDYQDENEYRIIVLPNGLSDSNELLVDISSCLKLIILGDRFPQVYLPAVSHLLKEEEYPFRRLHWESHSYILLQW